MKRKKIAACSRIVVLLLLTGCNTVTQAQLIYPVARKENFDTTIYGKKISDEYFWMSRTANEKEMLDFSKQQGQLTQSILDSIPGTEAIQNDLGEAYAALQDDVWNIKTAGSSFYYQREIPGEGIWLCRRKATNATEEKLLSKVVINGEKYSIRKRAFAHNKPLLALMLTQSGEANPQIRIFDLDKKEFLPDSIAPVMFNDSRGVSMTWLPDDKGLLYSQAPPTSISSEKYYNGKIKLHLTGTDPANDEAVFGSDVSTAIQLSAYETPYIYSFNHSPYLVARIRAADGDNYAFAVHSSKLNGKNTPWKRLKNYINMGDGFDATGNYLYAVTKGSSRYRVVKIDMETGAAPEIFIPQQPDVIAATDVHYSTGIIAGKDVLYILLRRIGNMQIIKVDYSSKAISMLPIKQKGSIAELALSGDNNLIFGSGSAIRATQYMQFDYASNTLAALPFTPKPFDGGKSLETQVIWIPSRDGKRIPVSLLYKKGLNLKNNNPLLIDGYGNSGSSTDLFYDPSYLPFINRGGIYAYAHVRGGGELGEDWIKDGQFPHKMNGINDAVDVAEYFVKNNYTSPAKQLIMGASAGSFLVGMAVNQRPDLFAAGLFLAGLPDIVTCHDAAFARESKSVGPVDTEAGFLGSYSISSYYHIPQNKKLPAMLIVHGATDYILEMHPAVRYTTKLQEAQKGERPVLLLVDWESGHNGSEYELLYLLKFALWQTGHPDFQLEKKLTNNKSY